MNTDNEKCVVVVDAHLPLGIIANTAAILGITIGKKHPYAIGKDVSDLDGNIHSGIIQFPVPILKADNLTLKELRLKCFKAEFEDLTVADFSDLAQGCKTYDEFIQKMLNCSEKDLNYIGLAICGNKKKVNKLTGNLPLLR